MTLRRRIGRIYVGVGVASAGLLGVVAATGVQFIRSGNDALHRWEPAAAQTREVLIDLVDQESALRGYALTRDQAHLDEYRRARAAQAHDITRLRDLLDSGHGMDARVDALSAAADRWEREVARPAVAAVSGGGDAASTALVGPPGRELFGAVRARAAALSGAVRGKADQVRENRRDYLIVCLVAMVLSVLTLLAGAVLFWRGLRRWVLRPIQQLGTQTREVASGDTYRQITVHGPVEFTELGSDVEAMRLQIAGQLARAQEIQEELRRQGEELARSNDDLQQFAYVASHDLSEPLRKVANFCQLLERQYGPQLDDRARQYIDFAVDGAKRMQRLISDLLALSRVGRTTEQFVAVDLDDALTDALDTLAEVLAESGAEVVRSTKLPVIDGDRSLLTSLFENLIGNAVKYRRENVTPVVRIAAEDDDANWIITVEDNGIGIDREYSERIFVVFQRLHLRDKYGGTGIGLALCRKIVEFHGGRIWLADVESKPGATFRFTVPKGVMSAEPRD